MLVTKTDFDLMEELISKRETAVGQFYPRSQWLPDEWADVHIEFFHKTGHHFGSQQKEDG